MNMDVVSNRIGLNRSEKSLIGPNLTTKVVDIRLSSPTLFSDLLRLGSKKQKVYHCYRLSILRAVPFHSIT